MKSVAIFLISFTYFTSANAETISPKKGLPLSLWESAELHKCDDLTNFYEETEADSPPFVFGLFQDGSNSAAFICSLEKKKIIIWQRNDKWVKAKPFTCPRVIESQQIGVGGLTFKYKKLNMSNYYNIKSTNWLAGPNKEVETLVIETEYYGLSTALVCYDGQWFFNNYD